MQDLVVLQWNMGVFKEGSDSAFEDRVTAILEELISSFKPDLIALQETPCLKVTPIVRKAGYGCSNPKGRMLTAWNNKVWGASSKAVIVDVRALAVVLKLRNAGSSGRNVLVCNVHFSSGLYGGSGAPLKSLKDLARKIKMYRTSSTKQNPSEIILGDFNLEPHQPELRDKDVLHGNRSLPFVHTREAERKKGEIDRRHLYNPAWQLYGSTDVPHGTHYLANEALYGPWFILDQALFSGDLVSQPAKVELVTIVNGVSLLSKEASKPDKNVGSDHLPIVWTIVPKP